MGHWEVDSGKEERKKEWVVEKKGVGVGVELWME